MAYPDPIQLKADLLVEGVNASAEALTGLGAQFKEQNHGLFGWDFVDHQDLALPDDFLLEDGTVVQYRHHPHSPYAIELRDGVRVVTKGEEVLGTVAFIPRPRFYESTTSEDRSDRGRGLLFRLLSELLLPLRARRAVRLLQPGLDQEDLPLGTFQERGQGHWGGSRGGFCRREVRACSPYRWLFQP